MATIISFKCNECNFNFKTSGPHEFIYKNNIPMILPHPGYWGHCDGLLLNIFCFNCIENKELIIVEYIDGNIENPFVTPLSNIKQKYLENYKDYIVDHPARKDIPTECFSYKSIKCPDCFSADIIYNSYIACVECKNCPICKTGSIETSQFIIT